MAIEPNVATEKIPDSTELAIDRTHLAHERTLMAWIRTAVSLISFGFTIYKFFQWTLEQGQTRHVEHLLGPRGFALTMIGIGLVSLLLASLQHRQARKRMMATYREVPRSLAALLAILISGLGIMAFLSALFRQ